MVRGEKRQSDQKPARKDEIADVAFVVVYNNRGGYRFGFVSVATYRRGQSACGGSISYGYGRYGFPHGRERTCFFQRKIDGERIRRYNPYVYRDDFVCFLRRSHVYGI